MQGRSIEDWMTAEHEAFRSTVQRFIRDRMEPFCRDWEEAENGHPASLWREAGEIGLLGLLIPAEEGGPGCDPLFPFILAEELSKSPASASLGTTTFGADLLTLLLVEFGTAEQKAQYFPRILSGESTQCIAISEPNAGSDVNAITTRARSDGDDFIINGQKTYISHAMIADLCYLVVKTDDDIDRGRGSVTMLLVDLNAPGVERRRLTTIGAKGSTVAELFFNDVRIPKSAVIGTEGGGLGEGIAKFLLFDLVLMSLRAMGAAQRAFDITLEWVKERKVFGKRVFDFQNTQFKLGEMKAKLIVADAFRRDLITKFLNGTLDRTTSSAAKLWCSEHEYAIADDCLQLQGGYGCMAESEISKLFSFARIERIYGGTNEIQKGAIGRNL